MSVAVEPLGPIISVMRILCLRECFRSPGTCWAVTPPRTSLLADCGRSVAASTESEVESSLSHSRSWRIGKVSRVAVALFGTGVLLVGLREQR